jgi:hypothetical protein
MLKAIHAQEDRASAPATYRENSHAQFGSVL